MQMEYHEFFFDFWTIWKLWYNSYHQDRQFIQFDRLLKLDQFDVSSVILRKTKVTATVAKVKCRLNVGSKRKFLRLKMRAIILAHRQQLRLTVCLLKNVT